MRLQSSVSDVLLRLARHRKETPILFQKVSNDLLGRFEQLQERESTIMKQLLSEQSELNSDDIAINDGAHSAIAHHDPAWRTIQTSLVDSVESGNHLTKVRH